LSVLRQATADQEDDQQPDIEDESLGVVTAKSRAGASEVAAIIGPVVSELHWGGVVVAHTAPDIVDALRQLGAGDVEAVPFDPRAVDWPYDLLSRAVQRGLGSSDLLSVWHNYEDARSALLARASELVSYPLLLFAGDEEAHRQGEKLLSAYDVLLNKVQTLATELRSRGSIDANRRLIGRLLSLDLVFFLCDDDVSALTAPTHPFHIWRWLRLAELLRDHGRDLSAEERECTAPGSLDTVSESHHAAAVRNAARAVAGARWPSRSMSHSVL